MYVAYRTGACIRPLPLPLLLLLIGYTMSDEEADIEYTLVSDDVTVHPRRCDTMNGSRLYRLDWSRAQLSGRPTAPVDCV